MWDAERLLEGQICLYSGKLPNVKAFADDFYIVIVEDLIRDSTEAVTSIGIRSMRSEKIFIGVSPSGYVPLVPIAYHSTSTNPMIEVESE